MRIKPSKFSPELGLQIGTRMATGEPLSNICRDEYMPSVEAAMDWLNNPSDPRFGAIVRQAFDSRLASRLIQSESMSLAESNKQ